MNTICYVTIHLHSKNCRTLLERFKDFETEGSESKEVQNIVSAAKNDLDILIKKYDSYMRKQNSSNITGWMLLSFFGGIVVCFIATRVYHHLVYLPAQEEEKRITTEKLCLRKAGTCPPPGGSQYKSATPDKSMPFCRNCSVPNSKTINETSFLKTKTTEV